MLCLSTQHTHTPTCGTASILFRNSVSQNLYLSQPRKSWKFFSSRPWLRLSHWRSHDGKQLIPTWRGDAFHGRGRICLPSKRGRHQRRLGSAPFGKQDEAARNKTFTTFCFLCSRICFSLCMYEGQTRMLPNWGPGLFEIQLRCACDLRGVPGFLESNKNMYVT